MTTAQLIIKAFSTGESTRIHALSWREFSSVLVEIRSYLEQPPNPASSI